MLHFGVLLSHHQGKVDYSALADCGIEFVNVKASEGAGFTDPTYDIHVQGARNVGMGVIAFHFWRPVGVLNNYNKFMAATKDNPPDLYELDWEVDGKTKSTTVQDIEDVITLIEGFTNKIPLLYTNPDFGNRYHPYISRRLVQYPLHVAHYDRGFPAQVKPWGGWDVWQSTQRGRLLGMSGNACIEVTHTDFWNLVDKCKGKEYHND